MMKTLLVVFGLVAVSVGCAATKHSEPGIPGASVDPVEEEARSVRRAQLELLWQFDKIVAEAGSCKTLCLHVTKICELATRICTVADQHKDHPSARIACEAANKTCRETNERLPAECVCR